MTKRKNKPNLSLQQTAKVLAISTDRNGLKSSYYSNSATGLAAAEPEVIDMMIKA